MGSKAVSAHHGFRRTVSLAGMAGLLLFIALVGYQGFGDILAAIVAMGWGLVVVSLFHLSPLFIDTLAWRILFASVHPVRFRRLAWIIWIGESVNHLLPVGLIGGGIVRVRLLRLEKVPGAWSAASVIVHITSVVVSLSIFSLLGFALLAEYALPGQSQIRILLGIGAFALLIYGFYLTQRRGVFLWLARWLERRGLVKGARLSDNAANLDQLINEIYAHPKNFFLACVIRLGAWLVGAGEVWLTLYFLNQPITVGEALMLEGLGQAIRNAAFIIPGALGVQEGGYLLLAASIGIAPEFGVVLSLVKRVRELFLGIPGLLVWHRLEANPDNND